MYELVQVAENTFYINSPVKIGIYRSAPQEVWIIDSGNDKEAGKKIQKILDAQGWKLVGILNTHSNADHIGGNELLQKRLGCPAYSTPKENAVITSPILEPSLLYGGYPMKQLRNKFLMAAPSQAQDVFEAPLPQGMEILPLDGHFLQMVGFKTPDGVCFLADSIFDPKILEKYHISFMYDPRGFFETLTYLESLTGTLFIPSHGEPTKELQPLIDANRDKALEILEKIKEICQTPMTFEGILKTMFDRYHLTMDLNQYVLVGSSIRSYLSYLADNNELSLFIEENQLFWQTISA